MKRDPVKIENELRQFVLDAPIDKLVDNRIPITKRLLQPMTRWMDWISIRC